MEDKLTYYDVVAHLVPGTIVLGVLGLIPRVFTFPMPWPQSGLVSLAAGIPLAYALGQFVQALSSFAQPIYYHLWGGMPSAVILAGGSKRLTEPRLTRIITALSTHFHAPADTVDERNALFSDAMALCNRESLGRVDNFNASYAFHRALLTTGAAASATLLAALFLALAGVGTSPHSFRPTLTFLLVIAILFTIVEFIRAKQRGEYFSIEVLQMGYLRAIDSQPPKLGQAAGAGGE